MNTTPSPTLHSNPAPQAKKDSNPMTSGMASTEKQAPARTTQSHFLSTPPEIRNRIYELVFNGKPEKVELLEAAAPSKSLLTTCHQIHCETQQMYRAVYRAYWSQTAFALTLEGHHRHSVDRNELYAKLFELDEQDVAHVKILVIQSGISYTPTDGVWFRFQHRHPNGLVGFNVVPKADGDAVRSPLAEHDAHDLAITGVWDNGNGLLDGEATVDGMRQQTQKKGLSKAELNMWIGWLTRDPRFCGVR